MFVNYVLNGQAHGAFAQQLQGMGYDVGYGRPFFADDGTPVCTINTGKKYVKDGKIFLEKKTVPILDLMRQGKFNPVFNNTTLRKEEWIHIDQKVLMANRTPLIAWKDLAAAATVSGFDGMSHTTYEYEAMSDPGEAMISMSGLVDGRNLAPDFGLSSIPIPIIHVDWYLDLRRLNVSRNRGTPLNTTLGDAAGARIGEAVEDMVIGRRVGPQFGTVTTGPTAHRDSSTVGSKIWGYTNFPMRQTKTDLTVPTGSNPQATLDDVLEMRDMLYEQDFSGPFMVYHSTDWDRYMDDDHGQIGTGSSYGFAPSKSLRQRLKEIDNIADVRRLPRLKASTNPFTLIMIQLTPQVAEAVNAAQIRTQQWETKGGWQLNFRTWAMQVPLLKYDYNENMGLVHATTS